MNRFAQKAVATIALGSILAGCGPQTVAAHNQKRHLPYFMTEDSHDVSTFTGSPVKEKWYGPKTGKEVEIVNGKPVPPTL